MFLAILIGFLVAPLAPVLFQWIRHYVGWVMPLVPLGLFAFFLGYLPQVSEGTVYIAHYEWVPSLGINITLRLDGLALLFALIITGVGTMVFTYAAGYLHHSDKLGQFYAYLLMFMASMLGVVLANNIILIFVFWELTSLTSYLLIGFYHHQEASREAAKMALITTGAAGLAMLAGMVLLSLVTDTLIVSEMVGQYEAVLADDLYRPILLLIGVGAFAKSAQFPFHYWLPGAMAAPAPVSAYLHSATMVKAGIYLLARLHPILGHSDDWHLLVGGVGGLTMLVGGYLAWQQTDVKRILAYTTISALGIIVFMLGIGEGTAIKAAMLFLVVHSLYKGAFFMVGGTIDHESGTRDITQLGGLGRAMPFTAAAAGLAALSMSGIPPLIGFWGKEVIYEATQQAHSLPPLLLTVAAIAGNLFNVTAALMVAGRPFWGQPKLTPKHVHEAPWMMWLPPLILGGVGLALGLRPNIWIEPLIVQPVEAVYGTPYEIHFEYAFNATLLLSVMTVAGGLVLWALIPRLKPWVARLDMGERLGPSVWYHALMDGTLEVANWQRQLINQSYLRYYLRIILGMLLVLIAVVFAQEADIIAAIQLDDLRIHEVFVAVVIIVAAISITQLEKRLAAIITLGVVGLGDAAIYIFFGAPDLAMTQVAIETLTVILFVLVLYRLPEFHEHSQRRTRIIDAFLAALVGLMFTALILISLSAPLESRLSPDFIERSEEAKGHNVVNVILVDFRGFDTMGEITVLSVAAIGVFALLKLNLDDTAKPNMPEEERD